MRRERVVGGAARDLIAVAVVGAAVAFSLACGDKASSKDETKTEKGDKSGGSASNKKADLTVDAKTILKDYKDNEVAADQKYKDKVVQISGLVGEIKKDITDDIYVTVGTGAEFEIPECQVYFDGDATKKAASLKKGDKLTVKGTVTGLMLNVQVKNAVFVE